jgi:hypothetical protein
MRQKPLHHEVASQLWKSGFCGESGLLPKRGGIVMNIMAVCARQKCCALASMFPARSATPCWGFAPDVRLRS